MTNWKHIGFASECDLCGGSDNVVRYKNVETDEKQAVCDPCEQAAAAAKS